MKKIKYLMLLISIFMAIPFKALAMSTLVCELNISKEGEESKWLPIYFSDIEEDRTYDIYGIATYSAKNNTLLFTNNGNLLSFSNDSSEEKYITTNYSNTISSLTAHHGGKINIGGRGKLKIEKSYYFYNDYKAYVIVNVNGTNKFLKDEEENLYYSESLGEVLANKKVDTTEYMNKALEVVEEAWPNLQKWNDIADISFDPSYVNIAPYSSTTHHYEYKYVDKEWIGTYINTNLDIIYLDDGILFDGSNTLEDNGIVFKSTEELPSDYTLKAEDIYDELEDEELDNYNDKLENKMMIGLFDISVNNGVTQIDIDSGKYTIRVPITDRIKDYTGYYVVYVKDGEIVDTIDAKVIDGKYIEFNTTHLSEYGIIADYIIGDLNKNSKIDLPDIILLLKNYLGILESTSNAIKMGDMNKNNKIDLQDIIQLLKIYLGIN